MKRTVTLLASVALLAAKAFAQGNNGPHANAFGGLVLNTTSSEDATRILGQPVADKTDRLDVSEISKWLHK